MKHLTVAIVIALAACRGPSTEEQAKRLIPAPSAKCVSETISEANHTVGKVSFCTDGNTLAICTSDDGYITINLPAERP